MPALTLTLDGPPAVLSGLIPLFARAHGWTADSPLTPAQHARDVLARFLRESVTAQAVADAQIAAAAAARSQATAGADALTLTLSGG